MSSDLPRALKLARLRKGWSLEDLAGRAEGIPSKQMLSKYENGLSTPTAEVLCKLAAALGVPLSSLVAEPGVAVEFVAFRKHSTLRIAEQERIKAEVICQVAGRRKLAGGGRAQLNWRVGCRPVIEEGRHAVDCDDGSCQKS